MLMMPTGLSNVGKILLNKNVCFASTHFTLTCYTYKGSISQTILLDHFLLSLVCIGLCMHQIIDLVNNISKYQTILAQGL